MTSDFGKVASQLIKEQPKPIPTWSPSLNWALVRGGFVPSKVSVLYGPESCGKSMLAMMAIIEMQRQDPEALAIWFDAEFSFSADFFVALGGDPDRLVVRKSNDPVTIFDYIGGELLEMLQDGAPIKALVLDSIRSIRYPKDNKKVSTDMIMGGTGANYLPSAFKMVIPVIAQYELMTLFIQQVSIQIDPMKALRNPYVLPDGQALKHIADVMLEIVKLDTKANVLEVGETIAGGAQQVGHKVRVKVKKNRMGAPARVAQFTFGYGQGIINAGEEIFDLAKSLGVIYHPVNPETGKENAQMWAFADHAPIRGEANMKAAVVASKAMQDEIMTKCYSFQDAAVTLDADGVVKDEDLDLSVEL
jgi:recombination protein RecA